MRPPFLFDLGLRKTFLGGLMKHARRILKESSATLSNLLWEVKTLDTVFIKKFEQSLNFRKPHNGLFTTFIFIPY